MSILVSKRYVKAILESFEGKDFDELVGLLDFITEAFKDKEFKSLLSSPLISSSQKNKLFLSLYSGKNKKILNFLNLLLENGRILIIPDILNGLKTSILSKSNEYSGIVYSSKELTESELKSLEKKFSKKFNSKIDFAYKKSDIDGIKVDIEELGIEVNFSLDKLKTKMSDYILKAI
ncbi:F0F1 ATP synthase subunit delta [uncultured Campylobacter sp.]|uniref:F0F1 ATP synthase subunit delta n=1 Tax=uncultured Campylobacter sp. TaxID=218934 RepID=UPI002618357E|nr:F0F1 ATP synthase subunit delta [uncultured Campylobacter sp.]